MNGAAPPKPTRTSRICAAGMAVKADSAAWPGTRWGAQQSCAVDSPSRDGLTKALPEPVPIGPKQRIVRRPHRPPVDRPQMLDHGPVVDANDTLGNVNGKVLVDRQETEIECGVVKLRHTDAVLNVRLTQRLMGIGNDMRRVDQLRQPKA